MKWFKHENTFTNPKIKLLKRRHGALGYAVYFQILELIGDNLQKDNQKEWGYLPKEYYENMDLLVEELGITSLEELASILDTCFSLGLLDSLNNGIYCEKILERCDDYTDRLLKSVGTKSEQSTDKVEQSRARIEQNRIEKNRTEYIIGESRPKLSKDNLPKGVTTAGEVLKDRFTFSPSEKQTGISKDWQEKGFRYAEKLGIKLDEKVKARWLKIFKQASEGRNSANLEKAFSYLVDYPGIITPQEKMMYFFDIYENGLQKKEVNYGR